MSGLKSLIRKWHWSRLANTERLLLQALVLFPLIALSLKLWGLQKTQAVLMKLPHRNLSAPSKALPLIIATVQMVLLATRYSKRWTCLKKSLVLWYLLHRQGIDSQLQIGVRLEQGQFQAHAWVEYQGTVVGDRHDVRQHYTALDHLNAELNDCKITLTKAHQL